MNLVRRYGWKGVFVSSLLRIRERKPLSGVWESVSTMSLKVPTYSNNNKNFLFWHSNKKDKKENKSIRQYSYLNSFLYRYDGMVALLLVPVIQGSQGSRKVLINYYTFLLFSSIGKEKFFLLVSFLGMKSLVKLLNGRTIEVISKRRKR